MALVSKRWQMQKKENRKEVLEMEFRYENYASTNGKATAREILQQPQMWEQTVGILAERQDEIRNFMQGALKNENLQIFFIGAGSSAFCAEIVAPGVNKYLGYNTSAPHTTDIVGSPDSVLKADIPTMLVSFGRSGNSPESIAAVEYARNRVKNLYEIAVTCADDGKLAKFTGNSDKRLSIILPPETNDEGFAMTSSLTAMAIAAYGILAFEKFADFRKDISELAMIIDRELQGLAKVAKDVAEKFDFDRVAFLGCGALKGAAHESTVKMCELTTGNVNVVHDTSLGFRHGPKFMIKDRTITVHMISDDKLTRKYDIDLLKEVASQKKSNKIVVLSGTSPEVANVDYDVAFQAEFGNDFYLSIACVVFSQLFAFFTSQKMGVNTDSPSADGAVNRVVQGVIIHPEV